MHKRLACFLVTSAGLLTPMIIVNAQAPEPSRDSGPVTVQDTTSSHEPVAVAQGNRPGAVSQSIRRSLSINSSYFKKFYTNAQIADVGVETMQGYSFYSHKLEGLLPQSKMVRVALRSATLFGNWHVSAAFEVAYHDLGHATRVGVCGGGSGNWPFYRDDSLRVLRVLGARDAVGDRDRMPLGCS